MGWPWNCARGGEELEQIGGTRWIPPCLGTKSFFVDSANNGKLEILLRWWFQFELCHLLALNIGDMYHKFDEDFFGVGITN